MTQIEWRAIKEYIKAEIALSKVPEGCAHTTQREEARNDLDNAENAILCIITDPE